MDEDKKRIGVLMRSGEGEGMRRGIWLQMSLDRGKEVNTGDKVDSEVEQNRLL